MNAKQVAVERFDAVADELAAISLALFEDPELSYEEHRASARLAAFLQQQGLAVTFPAWGLDTSFDAVAGNEGPTVVICAEYDALPEVGHACGHNIIAAAACGAGVALAAAADQLGFRVRVLGTPAEEALGGKIDLIDAGAFEGASAAMMIHPAPDDILDPKFLAIAHIDVEFHGKESHAAFRPQLGINALDAAVQAYVNVSTLRQALYPTDKVHGTITYGGGAPNVIPSYTSMSYYVRAATLERLDELIPKVEACFQAAAIATGCTHAVTRRGSTFTHMVNDPLMVELFADNSAALGRPMGRSADRDPSASGSSDMGNVSLVVPSIHPMLDINSLPAVNHQREFAAHTLTDDGLRALRDGAIAMAWTVLDLVEGNRWDELGR